MRVFVTGGCGFIGTNFIRWALARMPDVQITNLDLLTYAGNPANLAEFEGGPRYAFVHGDIDDAALLADVLPGHDAVVNFAAESHVDRSINGSRPFLLSNVVGANTLFEAAMRSEIPRFLHISADEAYGSIPQPESSGEDDKLEPNSPYAVSKASADLLARAYGETYGYPITVTRTTNNFGAYQFPEKVIPLFITNLIDAEPVPLYGTGENIRDWTYVSDNAAAQWLVLTEGEPGTIYNVGAGNEMTNHDLTMRLLDHFGCGEEMIRQVPDRPGHDLRYSVDASRVRDLGWKPSVMFDDALAQTVSWYRDHEAWWRPLKQRGATQRQGLPAT